MRSISLTTSRKHVRAFLDALALLPGLRELSFGKLIFDDGLANSLIEILKMNALLVRAFAASGSPRR